MKTVHPPGSPAAGLKSQVMSALRWSAVAKLCGQVVNWTITLVVIRLLAPADYGLVAMLTLIFMFVGMLSDLGFDAAIVQMKDLATPVIRQAIGAALLINLAIMVVLVAAAPLIADFYREPRLVAMTRVAALGFLATGLCPVYAGLLQREMRFATAARVEVLTAVFGNVVTLVLAWHGEGAWALILGTLCAAPFRLALLLATATTRFRPSFDLAGTRRLWTVGGNLLVTRVVWYWSSQADVLVAAKLLGKEAVGFYSVAVHLASLPMQRASGVINGVAFAAFAKIQHDRPAVASNTMLGVRLMAFMAFPVLWGIAATAPEVVRLAIGPTWQPSIFPLTLVALTIPIRMIGSVISTTIMSVGRVDIAMITTIVGAVIAPAVFVYAARFGIFGLSVAWMFVAPVLFLLNMFRALPILGLSLKNVVGAMWRPLIVAAVMFLVVTGLRGVLGDLPDAAMLPILVCAGALTYCGGSMVLNRASSVEALRLLFPGRFAVAGAASVVPGT